MARQLQPFPLIVPGFRGLNTQIRGALLGPEWATKLENSIIDSSGRVSARNGWLPRTSTPFGGAFISGIEYRKRDGSVQLVATTEDKVAASVDGGATWSDVTNSATFTDGDWYLVNFNDRVVGFQKDYTPLLYDGASASLITGQDVPEGGVGTAAFGRIWCVDADGVTIRYSQLLDPTAFSGTGAGAIDMTDIWPDNDTVSAISAYNNVLVVFGHRNIVVFSDNSGSEIGLSPENAVVVDTIPGIGCLSQRSVQLVGGDLWFVSNTRDLMSLRRVILEQKSGEIVTLSKNVSDTLRDSIDSGSFDLSRMRSAFSHKDRLYLLSLPVESSPGHGDEIGKVFVFDTRQLLEDGSARCVGIWNQLVPTVFFVQAGGGFLAALHTAPGEVGEYARKQDNGQPYRFVYESGWLDVLQLAPQLLGRTLILKRISGLVFSDIQTSVTIKWAFDFSTIFKRKQLVFEAGGGVAEWGTSEWGEAEWGGGVELGDQRVAASGAGQYIKVGMEAVIDGGEFSIQQIDLLAKVGRLKG